MISIAKGKTQRLREKSKMRSPRSGAKMWERDNGKNFC
jgi:hypothetical protein